MPLKKFTDRVVTNPLKDKNVGRRTGKNIKAGKNIRKISGGFENFDDYWSESEADMTRDGTFVKPMTPADGPVSRKEDAANHPEKPDDGVKPASPQKRVHSVSSVLVQSQMGNTDPVRNVFNPFTNKQIGRRTGRDMIAGKNIRVLDNGFENFDDYWSESDADSMVSYSTTCSGVNKEAGSPGAGRRSSKTDLVQQDPINRDTDSSTTNKKTARHKRGANDAENINASEGKANSSDRSKRRASGRDNIMAGEDAVTSSDRTKRRTSDRNNINVNEDAVKSSDRTKRRGSDKDNIKVNEDAVKSSDRTKRRTSGKDNTRTSEDVVKSSEQSKRRVSRTAHKTPSDRGDMKPGCGQHTLAEHRADSRRSHTLAAHHHLQGEHKQGDDDEGEVDEDACRHNTAPHTTDSGQSRLPHSGPSHVSHSDDDVAEDSYDEEEEDEVVPEKDEDEEEDEHVLEGNNDEEEDENESENEHHDENAIEDNLDINEDAHDGNKDDVEDDDLDKEDVDDDNLGQEDVDADNLDKEDVDADNLDKEDDDADNLDKEDDDADNLDKEDDDEDSLGQEDVDDDNLNKDVEASEEEEEGRESSDDDSEDEEAHDSDHRPDKHGRQTHTLQPGPQEEVEIKKKNPPKEASNVSLHTSITRARRSQCTDPQLESENSRTDRSANKTSITSSKSKLCVSSQQPLSASHTKTSSRPSLLPRDAATQEDWDDVSGDDDGGLIDRRRSRSSRDKSKAESCDVEGLPNERQRSMSARHKSKAESSGEGLHNVGPQSKNPDDPSGGRVREDRDQCWEEDRGEETLAVQTTGKTGPRIAVFSVPGVSRNRSQHAGKGHQDINGQSSADDVPVPPRSSIQSASDTTAEMYRSQMSVTSPLATSQKSSVYLSIAGDVTGSITRLSNTTNLSPQPKLFGTRKRLSYFDSPDSKEQSQTQAAKPRSKIPKFICKTNSKKPASSPIPEDHREAPEAVDSMQITASQPAAVDVNRRQPATKFPLSTDLSKRHQDVEVDSECSEACGSERGMFVSLASQTRNKTSGHSAVSDSEDDCFDILEDSKVHRAGQSRGRKSANTRSVGKGRKSSVQERTTQASKSLSVHKGRKSSQQEGKAQPGLKKLSSNRTSSSVGDVNTDPAPAQSQGRKKRGRKSSHTGVKGRPVSRKGGDDHASLLDNVEQQSNVSVSKQQNNVSVNKQHMNVSVSKYVNKQDKCDEESQQLASNSEKSLVRDKRQKTSKNKSLAVSQCNDVSSHLNSSKHVTAKGKRNKKLLEKPDDIDPVDKSIPSQSVDRRDTTVKNGKSKQRRVGDNQPSDAHSIGQDTAADNGHSRPPRLVLSARKTRAKAKQKVQVVEDAPLIQEGRKSKGGKRSSVCASSVGTTQPSSPVVGKKRGKRSLSGSTKQASPAKLARVSCLGDLNQDDESASPAVTKKKGKRSSSAAKQASPAKLARVSYLGDLNQSASPAGIKEKGKRSRSAAKQASPAKLPRVSSVDDDGQDSDSDGEREEAVTGEACTPAGDQSFRDATDSALKSGISFRRFSHVPSSLKMKRSRQLMYNSTEAVEDDIISSPVMVAHSHQSLGVSPGQAAGRKTGELESTPLTHGLTSAHSTQGPGATSVSGSPSSPRPAHSAKRKKQRRVTISDDIQHHSYTSPQGTEGSGELSVMPSMSCSPVHYHQLASPATPTHTDRINKIVYPEDNAVGLRRSQRTRVKPLEWYKNERIVYDRRRSGPVILAVEPSREHLYLQQENLKRRKRRQQLLLKKKQRQWSSGKECKRLSTHLPVPYDLEVTVSTDIPVIHPDTQDEILMSCFNPAGRASAIGPSGGPPTPSDPFTLTLITEQSLFTTGVLTLAPACEKPLQRTMSTAVLYFITYGKILVTINRASSVLQTGDHFFVPRGTVYRLKNLRKEAASLCFTNLMVEKTDTSDHGQHD